MHVTGYWIHTTIFTRMKNYLFRQQQHKFGTWDAWRNMESQRREGRLHWLNENYMHLHTMQISLKRIVCNCAVCIEMQICKSRLRCIGWFTSLREISKWAVISIAHDLISSIAVTADWPAISAFNPIRRCIDYPDLLACAEFANRIRLSGFLVFLLSTRLYLHRFL